MTKSEAIKEGATVRMECIFGAEHCDNPDHMSEYAYFEDGTCCPIEEE